MINNSGRVPQTHKKRGDPTHLKVVLMGRGRDGPNIRLLCFYSVKKKRFDRYDEYRTLKLKKCKLLCKC